jgi:hypothetical protein
MLHRFIVVSYLAEMASSVGIQGIFKQNIKPKCQIKWEEQYGGNID